MEDEMDTLALKGHEDSITCLLNLNDSRSLVTGSADRKIILWDIFKVN
jgi:WD40 repeat protein